MTDGVRRLSHEEAEMLISTRMDELLDRVDSRALLVHLQTCELCRAFAVQAEVLGRELASLPMLPASAIVDRQIRESIAKGNKRWSLAGLFPATGGNSGLRVALGALAVLTLVSVFLLIRMAGDRNGTGPSIEAPNGGIAQQLDRTATAEPALAQVGPTETARVVVPPAEETSESQTVQPTQTGSQPTKTASQPTKAANQPTQASSNSEAPPTATLDPAFAYTIDKTKTPTAGSGGKTPTAAAVPPTATEESGGVAVAAIGGVEGTPVPPVEESTPSASPTPAEPTATPETDSTEVAATETPEQPTEEPTEAPTEAPATATPTETPSEPTMTPTPVEISVDATEPATEPSTEPPAGETTAIASEEISVEVTSTPQEPDSTPVIAAAESSPTATVPAPPPAPTQTPQGPFTQPTIAPVTGEVDTNQIDNNGGGGTANDGNTQSGNGSQGSGQEGNDQGAGPSGENDGSPPIVASDGSDVEAASNTGGDQGDSPQIVSTDATEAPGEGSAAGSESEQSTEAGVGGEAEPAEPTAVATVDESIQPSGLDLSDTITGLPSGTSSPLGRLEFSPGMNLYAVTAPDGQLAVANLDGELVITLGPGNLPVWAGSAMMFSAPGDSGTVVGIWNSESGELSYVPASEDEASSDVPIGGNGSSFYFLRTFPDRPGAMEIHSASIDGSDNGAIWTSDSANLSGDRPVWSSNGMLVPTDSSWLLIGADGSEADLGANNYGYVGAPVLSPGEGLMAYSAGDQVIIAWTDSPGAAVATAPFDGTNGGYAFSTSGEEVVVSTGTALHVVSYQGDDLGTLDGTQPIGGVYWISGTIYYLQIGDDAALKSTSLDVIQGG